METAKILCPHCGKLITKISADGVVTIFGYCRRCRQEKVIRYEPKSHSLK